MEKTFRQNKNRPSKKEEGGRRKALRPGPQSSPIKMNEMYEQCFPMELKP